MTSNLKKTQDIPMHQLSSDEFENLCRDILNREQEVSFCNLYGTREQHGVDIYCNLKEDGLLLAECKCYESKNVTITLLNGVVERFNKHYETEWKDKSVKKLILLVASPIKNTKLLNLITEHKKQLLRKGIEYIVWDSKIIRDKLRPHPTVVRSYFDGEIWVEHICGKIEPNIEDIQLTPKSNVIIESLATQLELLKKDLNTEAQEELEKTKEDWKDGFFEKTINWIKTKKSGNGWSSFSSELRAKILILESNFYIEKDNLEEAEKCLKDADKNDTNADSSRAWAHLEYKKGNVEIALQTLEKSAKIENAHAKTAILIEQDKLDEATDTLLESEKIDLTSETLRLKSIINFLNRDIEAALVNSKEALDLKKPKETILLKLNYAKILFYKSVFPSVIPSKYPSWPEIYPLHLQIKNEAVHSALETALEIFTKIKSNENCDKTYRDDALNWEIATLAHLGRIEHCQKLAREQSYESNINIHFILLLNTLDVEYPIHEVIDKLTRDLPQPTNCHFKDLNDVVCLCSCYMKTGQHDKVLELVQPWKEAFLQKGAEKQWAFWISFAQAGKKDWKGAKETIKKLNNTDSKEIVKLFIEKNKPKNKSTLSKYVNKLEQDFQKENDPLLLLEILEIHFSQNKFKKIPKYKDVIIHKFPNKKSLKILAHALFNTRQEEECLFLLEENVYQFDNKTLPPDMLDLKADCSAKLGRLQESVLIAEENYSKNETKYYFRRLCGFYSELGDQDNLARLAKVGFEKDYLEDEDKLKLVSEISNIDKVFATKLWRSIDKNLLKDKLVPTALDLGYQLGLDDENTPFIERMGSISQHHPNLVKVFNIKEAQKIIEARKKETQKVLTSYQNGELPIHLIADNLGARIFSSFLLDQYLISETNIPPLYIGSGARVYSSGTPQPASSFSIALDLSSILLLNSLGLLETVFQEYPSCKIPNKTILAIKELINDLRGKQESVAKSRLAVKKLIDTDKISIIKTDSIEPRKTIVDLITNSHNELLLESAISHEAYLVDFLPLKNLDLNDIALPENYCKIAISPLTLLESLQTECGIAKDKISKLQHLLKGSLGKLDKENIPEKNSTLIIPLSVLIYFDKSDLLELICSNYKLLMLDIHKEEATLEQLRAELLAGNAELLTNLIKTLKENIENGVIEILPEGNERLKAMKHLSIASLTLNSLLQVINLKNTVVCSSDRFLTSYPSINNVNIVTIYEILKDIKVKELISTDEYYDLLRRIRKNKLLYTPIETDEIIHEIKQCQISNKELVETKELKRLRIYISICLISANNNQNGEIKEKEKIFFIKLFSSIQKSILDAWIDSDNIEKSQIISNYILENIYFDFIQLSASFKDTDADPFFQEGLAIASFIGNAIQLNDEAPLNLRTEYINWIFNKQLRKKILLSSNLLTKTTEQLKRLVFNQNRDLIDESEQKFDKDAMNLFLYRFYSILPDPIKEELNADEKLLDSFGISLIDLIEFSGFAFDNKSFWKKALKLKTENTPVNLTATNKNECILKYEESAPDILILESQDGKIQKFKNMEFFLLNAKDRTIHDFIINNRKLINTSTSNLTKIMSDILVERDPIRRIEIILGVKKLDITADYQKLIDDIRDQKPLSPENFIPQSIKAIQYYYYLKENDNRNILYDHSSFDEILDNNDIQEAFYILSSLPFDIFKSVTREKLLRKISKSKLKQLLRQLRTPLEQIHFVSLCINVSDAIPSALYYGKFIARKFLKDDNQIYIEAFIALCRYFWTIFPDMYKDYQQPDSVLTLSLAHSENIMKCCARLSVDPNFIIKMFSEYKNSAEDRFKESDAYYHFLNPRHLSTHLVKISPFAIMAKEKKLTLSVFDIESVKNNLFMIREESKILPKVELLKDYPNTAEGLHPLFGDFWKDSLFEQLNERDNGFQSFSLKRTKDFKFPTEENEPFYETFWSMVTAVYSDIPIPRNQVMELKYGLLKTRFVDLFKLHPFRGIHLLFKCSILLTHLNSSECNSYIRKEFEAITKIILKPTFKDYCVGKNINDDEYSNIISLYFEIIFYLSRKPEKEEHIQKFSSLMGDILYGESELSKQARQIIKYLYRNVPTEKKPFLGYPYICCRLAET